ncbi:O-antigen polymerase [Vibrio diabolicus]|uniref:O-antigen polymerase n=1 Tax=Vibrio diabolicus TaxID=50719 RepID=UPI0021609A12|nr:O-antigen polymerase [Vibrio diabolicus]MCS0404231.1 oligosaccharide repeat unit polymerase [Vibrio diabolicus]
MIVDIVYIFISAVLIAVSCKNIISSVNERRIEIVFKYTFLLAITFVHFVIPLLQKNVSYYRYQSGYNDYTYLYSLSYSLAFLVVYLLLSHFLLKKDNIIEGGVHSSINSKSSEQFLIVFFITVFVPAAFVMLSNMKDIVSLGDEYMSNRISHGAGRGALVLFPQFAPFFLLMFFSYIVFHFNNLSRLKVTLLTSLWLIFCGFSVFYYIKTGSRNTVFILLVNIAFIYFLARRISRRNLILIFLFLALLVVSFSHLGMLRKKELGYEDIESVPFSMMMMQGVNGAFGNDENILWMMENGVREYSYGISYIAAPLNFVPRVLWPGKPLGGGPRLVEQIYPGSYQVGKEGVSSLTTGIVAESYLNFSWLGIFLIPTLFLFLVRLLFSLMSKISTTHEYALVIYLMVALSVSITQAEFLGLFTRVVFILSVYFIIRFLIKFLSKV